MKEETGETYQSSDFAKMLAVADAKVGKTSMLLAGLLGKLPWQTRGGVVSDPENIHIITTDANALGHVRIFLTETCKASEECLQYKVYNMQEDYLKAFENDKEYASPFYNTLFATIARINERCKTGGVHAVIFSSITTIARAILRGISGPVTDDKNRPGQLRSNSMDFNKWDSLRTQLNELQSRGQNIRAHVIWEGHIAKQPGKEKDDHGKLIEKDTIQVPGSVGASWAANVEQVVQIKRKFGNTHENTRVDKVYFDTKPTLSMVASGRGFTELLDKEEYDITEMFEKLKLKVGNWDLKEGKDGPAKKS